MRIMLDTNVLISVLLFPTEKMNKMMEFIFTQHKLVLSSYVVSELNLLALDVKYCYNKTKYQSFYNELYFL